MTAPTEESQAISPLFIREREAWFKAGANAMASITFLVTLMLGALVSLVATIARIEPYLAVAAIVLGVWLSLSVAHLYIDVTARRTARHRHVEVDRF